jgi:hypothetical protein
VSTLYHIISRQLAYNVTNGIDEVLIICRRFAEETRQSIAMRSG